MLNPRLLTPAVMLVIVALAGCAALSSGEGERPGAPSTREGERPGEPSPKAQGDIRAGVFGEIPRIVREVQPSVVTILAPSLRGEGQGSGVIVRDDGLVVTNAHVVEGARVVRVAFASGDRLPAEVVAADRRVDLALVRVDRDGLPAVRFADAPPTVGELAVAVGNPLGFENSVTAGVVSGLNRSIPSGGATPALVDLLQTDAPISPGNSGGALVGADGRLLGVNVAFIPPQARAVSIGFAIPAPRVRAAIDDLLADGDVEEAFLGVILSPLTPQISQQFGIAAQEGAIVLDVERPSPAAAAGVRPGDVIVGVDGRPVEEVEQVLAALRRSDSGDRLALTLLRGDQRREVSVRVEER